MYEQVIIKVGIWRCEWLGGLSGHGSWNERIQRWQVV